jgi:hypothetical protein
VTAGFVRPEEDPSFRSVTQQYPLCHKAICTSSTKTKLRTRPSPWVTKTKEHNSPVGSYMETVHFTGRAGSALLLGGCHDRGYVAETAWPGRFLKAPMLKTVVQDLQVLDFQSPHLPANFFSVPLRAPIGHSAHSPSCHCGL